MAKCTECKARKGKRKCKATGTFICSLCCGQSRNQDKCEGCSFFIGVGQNRNYRKVPFYSTQQMADDFELQDIANGIESTLNQVASENADLVYDSTAAQLVELLLDHYHFKDDELKTEDSLLMSGYELLIKVIQDQPNFVPEEELVKVLGAVYRSIQRRTNGGREYLNFIRGAVGTRVADGVRILNM